MNTSAAKDDYRDFLKLFSLLSLFHFSFYFIKLTEEEGEKESHESNLDNHRFRGKGIKVQRYKITGPRLCSNW